MEVFIISFLVIAPAEMADKTQLLALLLTSRFKKPLPIILGMFAALFINHLAAALVGTWLSNLLKGNILHWLLGLSLFAAAIWALLPEKMELSEKERGEASHHSIFITTFISFMIAEQGDKTQLVTAALAAQFHSITAVILGSTAGMMAVNVPVILMSHLVGDKIPLKAIKILSGLIFAGLGGYELSKVWG